MTANEQVSRIDDIGASLVANADIDELIDTYGEIQEFAVLSQSMSISTVTIDPTLTDQTIVAAIGQVLMPGSEMSIFNVLALSSITKGKFNFEIENSNQTSNTAVTFTVVPDTDTTSFDFNGQYMLKAIFPLVEMPQAVGSKAATPTDCFIEIKNTTSGDAIIAANIEYEGITLEEMLSPMELIMGSLVNPAAQFTASIDIATAGHSVNVNFGKESTTGLLSFNMSMGTLVPQQNIIDFQFALASQVSETEITADLNKLYVNFYDQLFLKGSTQNNFIGRLLVADTPATVLADFNNDVSVYFNYDNSTNPEGIFFLTDELSDTYAPYKVKFVDYNEEYYVQEIFTMENFPKTIGSLVVYLSEILQTKK